MNIQRIVFLSFGSFLLLFTGIVPPVYAQKISKELINIYRSESRDEINRFVLRSSKPLPAGWKVLKQIDAHHYIAEYLATPVPASSVILAPANDLWKASDLLIHTLAVNNRPVQVNILGTALWPAPANAVLKKTIGNSKWYTLQTTTQGLVQLLHHKEVLFAELDRKPVEELSISDLDLSVNQVWSVGSYYSSVTGKGQVLSIKEELFDRKDIDIVGRTVTSPGASSTTTSHAGIMATLAAGNGNSYIEGLGAAPEVKIGASDFKNLLPDDPQVLRTLKAGVQNHSYGTGIENYYGIEAVEYDKQVLEQDTLFHVFSSGNSGNRAAATGVYASIIGYANLTGTFKQAKNVLVVGGTNTANQVEVLSSKGPAYDGRVKPELVSMGEDGTSGAAAISSGVVTLLKQAYKQEYGRNAPSALIKSILINSADDLGNKGPDFSYGYGKLNALNAIRHIYDNRFSQGSVTENAEITIPVPVMANQAELKITLQWNDLPAALNAPAALVNDLDAWLETPQGQRIDPWVLSSHPHADSLAKPAYRGTDKVNNTEQISLEQPAPGNYILHVRGKKVQGTQIFYIAWQTLANNLFEWTYPLQNDGLIAGSERYLRWNSTYANTPGILDISFDQGSSWQNLQTITDPGKNYLAWKVPDHFGKARLRMRIANTNHITPDFVISEPRDLNVGYLCSDKLLLNWKPGRAGSSYKIYTLVGSKMQVVGVVNDTIYKTNFSPGMSPYYAVSEVDATGTEGLRSRAIDVALQGTGCYVQSLLPTVTLEKTVKLDLTIGTTIDLKSITWQKQTGLNSYASFGNSSIIQGTKAYNFTDPSPRKGVNHYRVVLETTTGQSIASEPVSVVVLDEFEFSFYPNPVADKFTIRNAKLEQFELHLFDMNGRKVMTEQFRDLSNTIDISRLQTGVYILQIRHNGELLFNEKLIKQ